MEGSRFELAKEVARIRARDDYEGCYEAPIPSEIDRQFRAALESTAALGHADRARMARELGRDADVLACIALRLASWGTRPGERGALVAVLMAIEFGTDDDAVDWRNLLQLMSVWLRAVEIAGLSAEDIEGDVQEGLRPSTSLRLRQFLARPLSNRSLECMGLREVGSGLTMTFESVNSHRLTAEEKAAFMKKLVPRQMPPGCLFSQGPRPGRRRTLTPYAAAGATRARRRPPRRPPEVQRVSVTSSFMRQLRRGSRLLGTTR